MKRKKVLTGCFALMVSLVFGACGGEPSQEVNPDTEESNSNPVLNENVNVPEKQTEEKVIVLDGTEATCNGASVPCFEYIWHSDPSREEEWYEGEQPETDSAVYIAHDIWYYPELDPEGFTKERYDGETEWVYQYTAEGLTDYIYATLPVLGEELPTEMMHSAEEAYHDPVLHIVEPGTYVLQGKWDGQILVDLGDTEETFADEEAKVILKLNGVEVTCDTAPAFIAYSAYECDNDWEEQETWFSDVDTADAGVQIVIADGTVNYFTGANVYRLLKPQYKKNSTSVQKKAHKIDGAFYSFVSMTINGEDNNSGILNIRSTTFEGLDDELHLTINGGNINIYSQDDGINVNEDKVSVFTMNGGTLHIFAGLGSEGDVLDSNGYIVVNGGIIAGGTPSGSDEILDSDCGNTINGGEVINIGSQREGMRPGGMKTEDFPGDGEFPGRPDGEFPGRSDREVPERPDGGFPGLPEGEVPERPEGEVQERLDGELPEQQGR